MEPDSLREDRYDLSIGSRVRVPWRPHAEPVPAACLLCHGTGLREIPVGLDDNGVTLLAAMACLCVVPRALQDQLRPTRASQEACGG